MTTGTRLMLLASRGSAGRQTMPLARTIAAHPRASWTLGAGESLPPCRVFPVMRGFSSYPSHEVLGLPALSPTMEVGTISAWKVEEGASFSEGDVIAEIETDKATVDFTAVDDGFVAKILSPPGTEIKVGEPILVTVEDEGNVSAFADFQAPATSASESSPTPELAPSTPAPASATPAAASPPPAPAAAAPQPVPGQALATPPSPGTGRVFASPFARKLAREAGYDISQIQGTGPNNRVLAADVESFTPSQAMEAGAPASAAPRVGDGFVDFELSEESLRIADQLVASKQLVPHYSLSVDMELTALLEARDQLNQSLPEEDQLSVHDMFVKAAALAMRSVPEVNSSWMETFVRMYHRVDINIMVGVGDGLVAPVIRDAGGKGMKAISDEIRGMVEAAQNNDLGADDAVTGTFTIVNLGMYGVKSASPIISMPQAAVLALGTIEERVLPNNDPESDQIYRVAPMITATCAFDHRVVDGAVGAQWLAAYRKMIESPMTMLL